jgi:hypothetical protein
MKDHGVVAAQPDRSSSGDKRYVFPKPGAGEKRLLQTIHAGALGSGQFVRICRIDGGEVGIKQRMDHALNLDRTRRWIDSVQQVAAPHFPLGMTTTDLALELELDDRNCLLHLRHQQIVAQSGAARRESCGRVARIDFARQFFERRDDQAVALFELREPPVAQRDAQHRGD